MNILISNDDGIAANGIRVLTETLSKKHNVYVVAPDRERSAAGHSLTLHTPLRVEQIEDIKSGAKKTWVTTGTPGDCVKIAINAILSKEEQPVLGFPSIAVSLASMNADYEDFKYSAQFVSSLLDKLTEFKFPDNSILNVNIPLLNEEDIAGIAITELGRKMFTDDYEKRIDPRGKVYYWMAGELINEPQDSLTDIAAVRNNKISITPVTYEMTRRETIADLNSVLCSGSSCQWF